MLLGCVGPQVKSAWPAGEGHAGVLPSLILLGLDGQSCLFLYVPSGEGEVTMTTSGIKDTFESRLRSQVGS